MAGLLLIKLRAWKASITVAPHKATPATKSMAFCEVYALLVVLSKWKRSTLLTAPVRTAFSLGPSPGRFCLQTAGLGLLSDSGNNKWHAPQKSNYFLLMAAIPWYIVRNWWKLACCGSESALFQHISLLLADACVMMGLLIQGRWNCYLGVYPISRIKHWYWLLYFLLEWVALAGDGWRRTEVSRRRLVKITFGDCSLLHLQGGFGESFK